MRVRLRSLTRNGTLNIIFIILCILCKFQLANILGQTKMMSQESKANAFDEICEHSKQWFLVEVEKKMGGLVKRSAQGTGITDTINEAVGWRVVKIPFTTISLFKEIIWKKIPKANKYFVDGGNSWRAAFHTMKDWKKFESLAFGTSIVKEEETEAGSLCIFICPYLYITRSFGAAESQQFSDLFQREKMKPIVVDLTVVNGSLTGRYSHLKYQLALVKDQRRFVIDEVEYVFKLVVIPAAADDAAAELCVVSEGILVMGKEGWISDTETHIAIAKNPWFNLNIEEDYFSQCVFGFRPFETISNVFQFTLRALQPAPAEEEKQDEGYEVQPLECEFTIPSGFAVWENTVNQAAIDRGDILGVDIMFKCEEGWFRAEITKFYPLNERPPQKDLFQYEIRYHGSWIRQDIWFRENLQSCNNGSAVASWRILQKHIL